MDFVQLRNELKNKVSPVYVLFGTDVFLVNKATELISGSSTVDRFDASTTVREIITSANTFDMFGGKRILFVRAADEKILKDKEFMKYIASPNPNSVLIIAVPVEKQPTVKDVEIVNCNPLQGDILLKLIAKQIQDAKKNISAPAAVMLAKNCNNNFARISNEIVKLVANTDTIIDVDQVMEHATPDEEHQTFELGNAILKKDLALCNKLIENFTASGVEDYAVFGSLVASIRRVFYSLLSTATNDELGKFLKVSPFSVMYARRDYKQQKEKIARLYAKALDLEYKIKSGQVTARSAVDVIQLLAAL